MPADDQPIWNRAYRHPVESGSTDGMTVIVPRWNNESFVCPKPDAPYPTTTDEVYREASAVLLATALCDDWIERLRTGDLQKSCAGEGPWYLLSLYSTRLWYFTDPTLFPNRSPFEYRGTYIASFHRHIAEFGHQRFDAVLSTVLRNNVELRAVHPDRYATSTVARQFDAAVASEIDEVINAWTFSPIHFRELFSLLEDEWSSLRPQQPAKRRRQAINCGMSFAYFDVDQSAVEDWHFDTSIQKWKFRIPDGAGKGRPGAGAVEELSPAPSDVASFVIEFSNLMRAMCWLDAFAENPTQKSERTSLHACELPFGSSRERAIRHFAYRYSRVAFHCAYSLRQSLFGEQMVPHNGRQYESWHEAFLDECGERFRQLQPALNGARIVDLTDVETLRSFASRADERFRELAVDWPVERFDWEETLRILNREAVVAQRGEAVQNRDELAADFQVGGEWLTVAKCRDIWGYNRKTLSRWATKKCPWLNDRLLRRMRFPPSQPNWCYHRIDLEDIRETKDSAERRTD
ncbi:hypothetical protein GC176_08650 [bacterium]|nr:hypothetical protein [bacterium]